MTASAPPRASDRRTAREGTPRAPRRPGRAGATIVLLLVAALLAPVSLAGVWARDQLTDTGRYVTAVAPLARDHTIQNAIVDDVTDGVMDHVRLDGLLSAIPRPQRPALRERFTRGIREFVDKQVRQVVTGPSFPAVWRQVHRTAHRTLDATLGASGDAPVRLDVAPIIERVKHQLSANGLGIDIARRVPHTGTEIVLLPAADVPRARAAYQAVRATARLAPPAAALCLAAGLLFARRRRRALTAAALLCAAATALLTVALVPVRSQALDALPHAVPRPAAAAYTDALTASLHTGTTGLVCGALVTAALAAGSGPVVRAVRGVLRKPHGG
ncbi:hypothetical protein [Streptomyces benahoarensis]|uniref:hypothetical protein n=1 Tax=Streptomyces benahoarensis TaxID=2595054 RepID=UPI0020359024|nr:hypothetical protein [Streptomyces benahoarensis]